MKYIIFILVILLNFPINIYANSCRGELFSFKVNHSKRSKAVILDVLENLAYTCKFSLIFEDEKSKELVQTKKISYLNVNNFTLDALLELLLGDNNIFYEMNHNILKISYLKTKSFYIDYVSFQKMISSNNKSIKTGSKENGGGSTNLNTTSEFKFWSKIKQEIEDILTRDGDIYQAKKTIIDQDAGIITVTGTRKQLIRVQKYINKITNRLHKQILITAKIIELTYDKAHATGIDWTKFGAKVDGYAKKTKSKNVKDAIDKLSYLVGYDFEVSALINFLKTQGDVTVVSSPKILTLNNQPAVINVGEEKNYKYKLGGTTNITNGVASTTNQYEVGSTFVGTTLSIVPSVTINNFIMLKVNATISGISDRHLNAEGEPSLAPDIKIKQISSIVKVKNNKKVIIGGLIQKNLEERDNKVPLLGDLPILGTLFKSKKRVKKTSELIIVLTPRLVSGNGFVSLDNIEYGKKRRR